MGFLGFIVVFSVLALLAVIAPNFMPALGCVALSIIDRAANGFRWIGASNPIAAWLLLGALTGGAAGLAIALQRHGLRRRARGVLFAAAVALCLLYALSFA
jgi:hypothetical protein